MSDLLQVELTPLGRAGHRLYRMAYRFRRGVSLAAYSAIAGVSYAAAYFLRFDLSWPAAYSAVFWRTLAMLLLVRGVLAFAFSLSMGRWRFISTRDVVRLVVATAAGSITFFLLALAFAVAPAVPRSVIVLEWLLTTFLTAGLWIAYRVAYEVLRHYRAGFNGSARRVLIVGAGEAGNVLAREMLRFPTGLRPVAFLDDDQAKWGMRLNGIPILGPAVTLREAVASERIDEIIIAVPSATPSGLRHVVEECEETGLPFKVLPGIAEVLAGDVRLNQIRQVRIEDLLGREPIQLTLPELAVEMANRSVLITGAAGSIGSELARQIARHGPGTLVLFDQAETALFFLELELRERHPGLRIVSVVGDVVDGAAVERVFAEYGPDRVFHAAAYKHVPVMESNAREAVRNNVIGTWRMAEAAGRHGTDKFVLVSTDKAVRPVSVMGATKRVAEWVVLEMQSRYPRTWFAGVRFGNVLGSSGSVIPIFRRQLEEGKPLTVTHPEATRYFMTIPESVQLILQASLLGEVRGNIAMLEMGEPVRILDLARNLLALSGAPSVNGNRIVFTGLRPGERLHEELVAPNEETNSTAVEKVRVVRTATRHEPQVLPLLDRWDAALADGSGREVVGELGRWFNLSAAREASAALGDAEDDAVRASERAR